MAFAEWVMLAAAIEELLPCTARKSVIGQRFDNPQGFRRRSFRHSATQTRQQVERCGVQAQSEEIREEAMVAQAVRAQPPLEFLVTVLAFTALGVLVVCGFRQKRSSGTIGDDAPPVGSLRMGFAFDDHLPRDIPCLCLVRQCHKQPLFVASGCVLPDRLVQ
jgi:hypothetical protein